MNTAIVWFRGDLRLRDHAALDAACRSAERVIPLYIHAPEAEGRWAPGAASRAWLARSLAALDASLRERGASLLLRRGLPCAVLPRLAAETGAASVHFNRRLEPAWVQIDAAVARALAAAGIDVQRHAGNLLVEPESMTTGQGGPYKVFTPFWRRLSERLETLGPALPAPASIDAPALPSQPIESLGLSPRPRWDSGFWNEWHPGEAGALQALAQFVDDECDRYADTRNRPDQPGTSRLSPHLHFGELSPRQVLQAVLDATRERRIQDGRSFLRELGWREFGQHLLWHFPRATDCNLDPRYDLFPWATPDPVVLAAWQSGRTGVPMVDAGMRELWQTGWMHNRVRMVVASFLTKHLRYHWLHGARWFWDTLVDADLGNNTQGWQWSAGTGIDAAPFFRIFNPVLQGERFDPQGDYVRRWVPELRAVPGAAVHAPWKRPATLSCIEGDYPRQPIVDLQQARDQTLAAWKASVQGQRLAR